MDEKTYEVTLTTLTYGGEAMGRLPAPDNRVIFVPFALPGERVRVRPTEEKRGFVRAELLEVLEPSPERISPRCKHFGVCGGCHYQHMPYEAQLLAKEAILRDQLARIGKIENPPVKPIVPSPEQWNYRNHIQFHLSEEGKLGYFGAGETVLPISECHLPEAGINAFWPQLEFEPGAPIERISLRSGADGELMLVLESEHFDLPELETDAPISIVHLAQDDALVLAGEDCLVINVLEHPFRVSAGAFFQVNTAMAEKMVEHLTARLPLTPDSTLLDVYCGVGLFSAFLAPYAKKVIGIEASPWACEDFAANMDEFEDVELYEAPAEDVLPHLTARPEVILVDPPRAGLERRALDAIVALAPAAIAYVSCDPSTLARDAARLISAGYKLTEVTPFDLFPQTYHIESISIFEK